MELDDILQKKEIAYLKNEMGTEIYIQIYGNNREPNDSEYIKSYLIPKSSIEKELKKNDASYVSYCPGFVTSNKRTYYKRFSTFDDIEPLVIERDFQGLAINTIEIIEEFRLFFNLYFDKKTDIYKCLNNNVDVVFLKPDGVWINQKFLRLYLGAKNNVLVLFKDRRVLFSEDDLFQKAEQQKLLNQEDVGRDYRYSLTICDCLPFGGDPRYCSMLYEKKIIMPLSLKNSGICSYNAAKKYATFKIGWDKDCNDIEVSCNPNKLNNFFEKNNNAYDYLTPVFFRKEVLDKYRKDDRYEIKDGLLSFGTIWSMYIDNDRDDEYISAYLGDLGTYLPDYQEQQYWASYNVVCGRTLSKVKYQRDFLAKFTNATDYLNVFKNKYLEIKNLTKKQWGWSLYLDLSQEDEYVFRDLYIPSDTSQSELDNATLLLNKLMNDVINDAQLKKIISTLDATVDLDKLKGTINHLAKFFELKRLVNYEEEIKKLRFIQDLRSSGSCHPKGKNYVQARKKANQTEFNNGDAFRQLLKLAYEFLCYVENNVTQLGG